MTNRLSFSMIKFNLKIQSNYNNNKNKKLNSSNKENNRDLVKNNHLGKRSKG